MRVPNLESLIQAVEHAQRSRDATHPWKPTYPELSGVFTRLTQLTLVLIGSSEVHDIVSDAVGYPALMEQTDPEGWSFTQERVGHVRNWITSKYLARYDVVSGNGYSVPSLLDILRMELMNHEDAKSWS